MMKFSLEGKRAVVTGASRGIGEAIAVLFAEHGADVVVSGRTVADLEGVAEQVRQHGRRAAIAPADMLKPQEAPGIIDVAVRELGGVDILVNNAGGAGAYIEDGTGGLFQTPVEAFEQLLNLNVLSAYAVTRAAAGVMRDNGGGAIVNNTSNVALAPAAYLGAYSAAKAALQALTRAWSIELGQYQIRVNSFAPGGIVTQNYARLIADPAARAIEEAKIPLGWLGEPVDAAGCALFFASDEARWINGATILLSGGRIEA